MARTIIGLGDPKAVKKYSGFLAVDVAKESYWTRKFMGEGETAQMPLQRFTELENDAGEQITFDLSMQLKQQPIEGDDTQEGTEEELKFYTDQVYIDQMRGGVNTGGKMTRKRTLHNLRKVARRRQSEWWARIFDEIIFIYLSGIRGENADFILPTSWTGRSNNSLSAPDSAHYLRSAGRATVDDIVAADYFNLDDIDRALVTAKKMGGGIQGVPRIQPIKINGENHFCLVMSPYQAHDLRTRVVTAGSWLDIQKAAATAEGRKSPIFKGGLGMYNNVVLHEHENIIEKTNANGTPTVVGRALFMGVQAGAIAFGSPGTGLRFDWHEEARDNGNQVVISTSSIWGFKKVTYNGLDFGVMAVDTASNAPA